MSVLSCPQNALDDFPSARLSLARLCPHRALFRLTVRVPLEHTEGDKSMIFRAYASKNPGVWGGPQGALVAQRQNNGNRKFTIFAILLLPNIKTVADTIFLDPQLNAAFLPLSLLFYFARKKMDSLSKFFASLFTSSRE